MGTTTHWTLKWKDHAQMNASEPTTRPGRVYERLGVQPIINAAGSETAAGGTLMPQAVLDAMAEAAGQYVLIEELNAAVGRKIAEATGAEAGYVTSGAAGGLLLAAAACIAGDDPVKVDRLPQSDGMANEFVIHRVHRINYDHMFRAAGGRIVEIGLPRATYEWELHAALAERTAGVVWVDSPSVAPGALPFDTVARIAHERGVPVIVDAASTLPPVHHLRHWIERGADLVSYSGGKGIRGPQNTGLLAGRADLIAGAAANGSPRTGVGRAAKVSKEAMAGLAVALELFLQRDHAADFREHLAQAEAIRDILSMRDDVEIELIADQRISPDPVVRLAPAGDATWTPDGLRAELLAGNPRIYTRREHHFLVIRTHCLEGDQPEIVARAILDQLGA
jgi:D-glucosaminate-6-phosphate ammonia-lyase